MAIDLDTAIGIVGAGAAGLGAAWFLQKRGYRNVTVLEKSDHVGGKCNTFVFQGKAFDMGALEVAEDYVDIRAIATEVGAELTTEPARRLIHPLATIW
ncbi:MAG: FAD-dependent oxidoreductase, partial [Polyangiales bacterium]